MSEGVSRVLYRFVGDDWIAGCVFWVVGAGCVVRLGMAGVGRWVDGDEGGWRRYERDVACYLEPREDSVIAKKPGDC